MSRRKEENEQRVYSPSAFLIVPMMDAVKPGATQNVYKQMLAQQQTNAYHKNQFQRFPQTYRERRGKEWKHYELQ